MDITLKQLEIFRAVVISGSITKASRRVGLAQPSISQQLAKLEERLNTELINRSRSGTVSLTPSGEYWFKIADDMLRRLDQALTEHDRRHVDNRIFLRMGMSPTLRGRFLGAAGRIAGEEPGFAKFEVSFALTSSELVEQLKLHQLNMVIVSEDALKDDRSSLATAPLFRDPLVLAVPAHVGRETLCRALKPGVDPHSLDPALLAYVEIDANIPTRPMSDAWYRSTLPFAQPLFSAMTFAGAIDLVAEGLATTHVPLSLLPSLPNSVQRRLMLYSIPGLERQIVLAMPKHLMSLSGYANIFKRLTAYCREAYGSPFQSLVQPLKLQETPVEPNSATDIAAKAVEPQP